MNSTLTPISHERTYKPTPHMMRVEADVNFKLYGKRPTDGGYKFIHELIVDALRAHDSDRDAANSLDMFPPTFSHWIARCNLVGIAAEIRAQR